MSEYSSAGGPLKFKADKKSKRKSKKKLKEKRREEEEADISSSGDESARKSKPLKRKTPAEMAYEDAKRKKQEKDLLKKAEKTHKERIMDFNQHLDSLSEHYDIPKVSWTK